MGKLKQTYGYCLITNNFTIDVFPKIPPLTIVNNFLILGKIAHLWLKSPTYDRLPVSNLICFKGF